LQRSPGRGDRRYAARSGGAGAHPADPTKGILRIRGSEAGRAVRRPEAVVAHGAGECGRREEQVARAAQGDRKPARGAGDTLKNIGRESSIGGESTMRDEFSPERGWQGPLEYVRSILIPAETLEAWAVQHRLFALTHRRVLVAATSGRLILLNRHLIGGFDVTDMRWQDLEEVTLRVGIFAADLTVRAGKASDLASQGA